MQYLNKGDAVVLSDGANIAKAVAGVIRSSATVAANIHAAAMQALMHAAEHGDPVYLDRLFKGIHDSQRPLAIKRWAMAYGPLSLTTNKAGEEVLRVIAKTRKTGEANPAWREFDIQGAADHPYWTFKADAKVQDFTLQQLLKFVADKVKAGEKAIDDDLFTGNVKKFVAARDDLLAVVEKYSGDAGIQASETVPGQVATPQPVEEPEQPGVQEGQIAAVH